MKKKAELQFGFKKDIIMKVKFKQRDHQFYNLLRIFNKALLQFFSITNLKKKKLKLDISRQSTHLDGH